MNKNYILNHIQAGKKLQRMALEIAERNTDAQEIVLAGIRESGSVIARYLEAALKTVFSGTVLVVKVQLDKQQPADVTLEPAIDVTGKVVILVDDVAMSGKTLTYALKPFLQAYPQKIQTLVLVDRTHKAFPVQPDYTGLSIATTLQEHIFVEIEGDQIVGAYME